MSDKTYRKAQITNKRYQNKSNKAKDDKNKGNIKQNNYKKVIKTRVIKNIIKIINKCIKTWFIDLSIYNWLGDICSDSDT